MDILLNSIARHDFSYGQGLEPMLNFMSKHGLPSEYPTDGSHFVESIEDNCTSLNITDQDQATMLTRLLKNILNIKLRLD